ncbi:restriction endonuclease subunit S [Plebeiibacterium sediminum]|uniref:Restriction endonuclease subunit S n=1 Tax=Plebeiibacterium sediminum TaxID=2992112 RepID=A0AAE3M5Y7_9BACT|nr:restriction endonuclease subunit S [Plebeiobacterium sediminum]MCW3787225.1 restriction endonuclease subunit S [Plebeiobacterium sediminum]
MESEWKEVEIGTYAKVQGGFAFKGSDFQESGIPVAKIKNVKEGEIDLNDCGFVSEDIATLNSNFYVKKGDVLISMTGSGANAPNSIVGRVAKHIGDDNDFLINQRVGRFLIKDESKLDEEYLYYYLRPKYRQWEFVAIATGSANQVNISSKQIESFIINLPPLQEQKTIAHILGSLDDKIELNRQMNQTLEQMAQALFKSWFVDFDQVIDNALTAGNPIPDDLKEKAERRLALGDKRKPLPEDIQNLFPCSFVFNEELDRWIPEGWRVKSVNDFINVKHGFAFKGEFFSVEPTNDILLTPGNFKIGGGFKGDKFKYYNGEIPSDYILKKNDLLITMTDLSKEGDTLGFPAFVPETKGIRYLHNQRLGKVEYKNEDVGPNYLYYSFCTKRYRDEIVGSASGTTVKHTSPTKICSHKIVKPEKLIVEYFELHCQSLQDRIQENEIQIEQLTTLRDTLLPKLISGEVRVKF